ncbi:MAG: Rne/Rng family ribonuclease [Propionibacteriaceae bacterium]|jgi:ribonuclease E|nr:Rne/Rng family ribonuclease [Propionibacteriaceae bacterium]
MLDSNPDSPTLLPAEAPQAVEAEAPQTVEAAPAGGARRRVARKRPPAAADNAAPTDAAPTDAGSKAAGSKAAEAVFPPFGSPAAEAVPAGAGDQGAGDQSAPPAPRTARRRRSAPIQSDPAQTAPEQPVPAQPTLEIGPADAPAKAIAAEPPAKAIAAVSWFDAAAPARDQRDGYQPTTGRAGEPVRDGAGEPARDGAGEPARDFGADRPAEAPERPAATAWVETSAPAPVRSRRGRRPVEASAATATAPLPGPAALTEAADGSGDAIAEALQELSQTRGRSARRRRPTETGEARPVEALDQLAAAIADDDAEPTAELEDGADEADGDDLDRRRRRRRGGRRHRRGEGGEAEADEAAEPEAAEPVADAGAAGAKPDEDEADGRRRRRRRHRDEEPAEAASRQRESKSKRAAGSVTGIEGSTRLEAKRQRRREGRVASRRRAPILSEAEFLARREAVDRTMVVRQSPGYSQIAVMEDGILVEHYVDRAESTSLIGNVYLGRVQNVLPSMEAAFVDIGRGRNAVLFAGEVDWDSLGVEGEARKMEDVFTSGQTILVQVTKDPIGAKGARLTSHISIPGRYIVYAPGGHLAGISRKLADQERARLKSILDNLVGDKASVIIRTAAEGATTDELVHDINRLKAQWEVIEKKAKKGGGAQLLYAEPDLTMRIVRDLFTGDFSELVVDGDYSMTDAFDTVEAYVQHVAPNLADRVRRWDRAQGDLFARYRIDEQIAKALDRKVHLPSGGTLIIDRTEAMTVIDVNTGKFTGSGGTLEATVTSNNLEAAEEIVRQLRLRDIGGIVVIDFIDMVLPANRELLLKRLVECLSRDRTRHQVSEVTSLGLVQLTRKRVGTGLAEAFTTTCDHCGGLGYLCQNEPVDNRIAPDGGDRSGRRNNNRRGKDKD